MMLLMVSLILLRLMIIMIVTIFKNMMIHDAFDDVLHSP